MSPKPARVQLRNPLPEIAMGLEPKPASRVQRLSPLTYLNEESSVDGRGANRADGGALAYKISGPYGCLTEAAVQGVEPVAMIEDGQKAVVGIFTQEADSTGTHSSDWFARPCHKLDARTISTGCLPESCGPDDRGSQSTLEGAEALAIGFRISYSDTAHDWTI